MSQPASIVRFGVYEVDLRSGELRKNGLKVRLDGQPMQVLKLLLEHPGDLVMREELKQSLWSADTFVDFEVSINAAVKRLRQALDDSADTPRFIETLPKRGYRFICPLSPAKPPRTALKLNSRAGWGFGGLSALIALSGAMLLLVPSLRERVFGRQRPIVRSVVVLPLDNFTGDPNNEYLTRGFADDLTHEILRVDAWDAAPFESAMTQKASGRGPVETARTMGVDACIAGTLQQDGERFRVNLKLVYAADNRQLAWSYWPTREEMAGLPRRAVLDILQGSSVTVPSAMQARLERKRKVSPDAYAAYTMGRNAYWSRITEEGHRKSIDFYEQAIAADPDFAEAYAAKARSLLFLHQLHPAAGFKNQARAAAFKALELDPELAEPHALLANMKRQEGDARGAEEEYKLALRLNPRDALAHVNYSIFLEEAGRKDEALQEGLRAEQLDRRSAYIAAALVLRLDALGHCEEAITQGHRAQQLDPNLWMAYSFPAGVLWHCGRREEAVAAWEKALSLPGVYERWPLSQLVVAYAVVGRKPDAQKAFARLRQLPDVEPDSLAAGYAALGNKKEAIRILQAAQGRVNLVSGRMAGHLRDLLGTEPVYEALLRRQRPVRGTQ